MNDSFLEMIINSVTDRFSVTTEKTVSLVGADKPCQFMVKRSTYGIKCHKDYPAEFLPTHTWAGEDACYRLIKNHRSGERYILCALDKAQGFGSSEFINPDTGDILPKYRVKKWLPETTFDSCGLFPVKVNSIKELYPIPDPVAQTVMAPADTGRDELPF